MKALLLTLGLVFMMSCSNHTVQDETVNIEAAFTSPEFTSFKAQYKKCDSLREVLRSLVQKGRNEEIDFLQYYTESRSIQSLLRSEMEVLGHKSNIFYQKSHPSKTLKIGHKKGALP